MSKGIAAAIIACLLPTAGATAADLRDYCPDRPGLGTPSCTIDPGHLSIELGLGDWTLDRSRAEREDRLLLGNVLLRYGIGAAAEIQLGWNGFGRDHDRDRLTGITDRQSGAGDMTVALRRNLRNPDGSGFSAAVMATASLPVGRQPIGAGDWGARVSLPMSWEMNDRFSLEFVPEADAAVDEDGDGRHLAYGAVGGVEAKLSEAVTATAEYQLVRDRDPAGHATQRLAGLSLAWQPKDDLQFDVGANGGLNRHAPDVELYLGVARRF